MKKKTKRGAVIETTGELIDAMLRGEWVYFGDRAYSPGWVQSWHFGLVVSYVKRGMLFRAMTFDDRPYVSEVPTLPDEDAEEATA